MAGSSGGSEPTFYETLGVGEDASAAEVRAAYRERAKDTHPDVSDAPDAGRRFRRIKRAHDVLTDERERRLYDRLGHEAYVERDGSGRRDGAGTAAHAGGRATADRTTGSAGASGTSGGGSGGGTGGRSGRTGTGRDRDRAGDRGEGGSGRGGDGTGGGGGRPGAGDGTTGRSPFDRVVYGLARWIGLAGALVDAWQSRLGPAGAATALATFAAYPVLLASTVTPLFPLPVNLLVGTCTLGVVCYLVLRPAIGVAVLGAWLLMLPAALTVSGIGIASLGGLYALVLTGVPLVLCVATLLGASS